MITTASETTRELISESSPKKKRRRKREPKVDLPITGYTKIENWTIPILLAQRPLARSLYLILARMRGADGTCFPSIEKLSALVDSGKRAVEVSIDELKEAELIRRDLDKDTGLKTFLVISRPENVTPDERANVSANCAQVSAECANISADSRLPERKNALTRAPISRHSKKTQEEHDSLLPPELDTPAMQTAWKRWFKYRKEKKQPIGPEQANGQIQKLVAVGHDRALAMIDHTIAMGWQGLREDNSQPFPGKPREPDVPADLDAYLAQANANPAKYRV